jgi:expansin (peptidoglycan-binding protein)
MELLLLEKWQLLLIHILKHGSTTFNSQQIYKTHEHFYPVVKLLLKKSYITLEKNNDNNEKFYILTLKGEILARILR